MTSADFCRLKKWISILVGVDGLEGLVAAVEGPDGGGVMDWMFTLLAVEASDDDDGNVGMDGLSFPFVNGAGIRLLLPSSMKVRKVR